MSGYTIGNGALLFDGVSKWFTGVLEKSGREVNVPSIVAQSAVPISLTGTLVETTLASITIPGGMIGANGSLRITALWSCTNNANAKDMKTKFSGNNLLWLGVTATASAHEMVIMRNRGAANSQVAYTGTQVPFGVNTGANQTYSVNTAVDQTLSFVGQLANAADTITLEGYTIEVLPSA